MKQTECSTQEKINKDQDEINQALHTCIQGMNEFQKEQRKIDGMRAVWEKQAFDTMKKLDERMREIEVSLKILRKKDYTDSQ